MFCFTRLTAISASVVNDPGLGVGPDDQPSEHSCSPARPLILPPAMIGTSVPPTRPMRRLKKGNDVLTEAETEREDVGTFEEERALLGKEQRESREIRAPRVDFCFGEIGVDRQRREDARSQSLIDVEAGLKFAVNGRRRRGHAAACRDCGSHGQSEALSSSSGRSVSRPARLVCVTWY